MTTSCNNHLSSATMHNHFLCCRWFILYKHQWNTRWAFARKLDIFTCENTMLSLHVKISPLLYWLHNKSPPSHQKLLKWNGLIFHWCLYNKQNITWPLGDTKFLFLCWKNISSLEEKFHISVRPCYINILYSLYKHQRNRIYMADSIKVALQGIGKLLLGSHLSKSLHCSICPKDQFITKATFLDLAVCQVSFCTKTWYLQMWKFRVIFTREKITVATAT